MPISNDAFGQALYDYLKGSADREVIERDDGYVDTSDGPQIYFRPYRSWPRHEREALRHARGRVLDVGCGAGRHVLHLQQKGFPVVAIDVSPLAVRVCRLRGVADARVMNVTGVSAARGSLPRPWIRTRRRGRCTWTTTSGTGRAAGCRDRSASACDT